MLRTGWEDDTPSADTIALAAMRAMADRAAALAEAAGGKVRRGPGWCWPTRVRRTRSTTWRR